MHWYNSSSLAWSPFSRREKIMPSLLVLCAVLQYVGFIFTSRYQDSISKTLLACFEYQNLPIIQRPVQEASGSLSSDECWDPYSNQLLNKVEQNCSAFRFVTIPGDGGRYAHQITQAYILFVFLRQFEAKKAAAARAANITADLTYVPLLPHRKENLLCQLFQRPPDIYLRKELVEQICSVKRRSWVSTSFATWEANFGTLSEKNIILKTWPMPMMYVANNSDIFQLLFTLHPGWIKKGDNLKRQLLENASGSYGEVGFVHIRRQDYPKLIAGDYKPGVFNGSHVQALINRELENRPNSICLIVSDDEKWCKENLELGPRVILTQINQPEVAFALMVQCDFSITTYGVFGFWGGLLNGGKIVRLLPRFENNSLLAQHIVGQYDNLNNVEIVYYP